MFDGEEGAASLLNHDTFAPDPGSGSQGTLNSWGAAFGGPFCIKGRAAFGGPFCIR